MNIHQRKSDPALCTSHLVLYAIQTFSYTVHSSHLPVAKAADQEQTRLVKYGDKNKKSWRKMRKYSMFCDCLHSFICFIYTIKTLCLRNI